MVKRQCRHQKSGLIIHYSKKAIGSLLLPTEQQMSPSCATNAAFLKVPQLQARGKQGVLLTTAESRSSPLVPLPDRLRCNNGKVGAPGYETSQWMHFQPFIPSLLPENLCKEHLFVQRWTWSGTTKRYMLKDTAAMNAMRAAAQNRWEAGKEKEVSEDEWKSFANSLPKLCLRVVDLKGEPLSDPQGNPLLDPSGNPVCLWKDYGVIADVWCDY